MDIFAKYEYVHVVHSYLHQNMNTFEEIIRNYLQVQVRHIYALCQLYLMNCIICNERYSNVCYYYVS